MHQRPGNTPRQFFGGTKFMACGLKCLSGPTGRAGDPARKRCMVTKFCWPVEASLQSGLFALATRLHAGRRRAADELIRADITPLSVCSHVGAPDLVYRTSERWSVGWALRVLNSFIRTVVRAQCPRDACVGKIARHRYEWLPLLQAILPTLRRIPSNGSRLVRLSP
jgi:hypothetical protein